MLLSSDTGRILGAPSPRRLPQKPVHETAVAVAVAVAVAIVLLVVPNVIWVFRDQSVWPWDQASYGEGALQLADAARNGFAAWLKGMMNAGVTKPPLLQWSAQAAVPLESILGSYERALLLVNIAAGAATLALVFSTVLRLGGSPVAGLAAVLLCGGAPLFIGMMHQFLVEPVQALTLAGLMRLSLEAGRLSGLRFTAATSIMVAFALLAKTTSLVFVAPFVLYMILVRLCARGNTASVVTRPDLMLAGAAAVLIAVTIGWYAVNWHFVLAHIRNATSNEVALHYGSIGTLAGKLHFWGTALMQALSPWPVLFHGTLLTMLAALGVAAVRSRRSPLRTWLSEAVASGTLLAFCIAGTVLAALLAFASQINEETRFLTPLVPLVGVLAGWSVSVLHRHWLPLAAAALFAGNAAAGHLHAHGMMSVPATRSPWLTPYKVEPGSIERLARAVRLSCDPHFSRYSFVGVELPDFNPNSAAFFSQKQKREKERGFACGYTFIGYAETDPARGVKRIYDHDAEFFVTLRTDQIPTDPADGLNRIARPVAEYIANAPDWERVSDPAEPAQVFRRRR
jgi:hypothetical protein